jgi:NADH dehydrogenase
VLTFREILNLVREWTDRDRGFARMPFWLAKLQALLTSPLPNSLRPLTYDQVLLLQKPSVVSDAAKAEHRTLANLGITAPHGVAAIVPTYLERFRPRGQFAHYRT